MTRMACPGAGGAASPAVVSRLRPAPPALRLAPRCKAGCRSFYAMPYERFFIWGATAGMLRNLFHFLRA